MLAGYLLAVLLMSWFAFRQEREVRDRTDEQARSEHGFQGR
jgi:hypothetical protein